MISWRRSDGRCYMTIFMIAGVLCASIPGVDAGELLIGTANVSITPSQPVALSGQVATRIAHEVERAVTRGEAGVVEVSVHMNPAEDLAGC